MQNAIHARTNTISSLVNGGTTPRGRLTQLTRTLGFFFACALAMISTPGCDKPAQAPEPTRIYDVSIGNLMRTGKDYLDYYVRVRLPANSYSLRPHDGIEFPAPRTSDPPNVIFLSNAPPKDTSKPVIIVGIVTQVIRDGVPRGVGIDHQLIVANCTITADP